MKRKILPLLGAVAVLAAVPALASAHTHVFLGINLGALFNPAPIVYAAPPPVVYAPPVPYPYYGRPVYYAQGPYYGPTVYIRNDGWWHDRHWDHDRWEHDHWRRHDWGHHHWHHGHWHHGDD